MKIIVTLNDPDAISDAICDAVTKANLDRQYEMTSQEYDDRREAEAEKLFEALQFWIGDGAGQIKIEFDTAAGTARVIS